MQNLPPPPPAPKREEMFTNPDKYKRDRDAFLEWGAEFTEEAWKLAGELAKTTPPEQNGDLVELTPTVLAKIRDELNRRT